MKSSRNSTAGVMVFLALLLALLLPTRSYRHWVEFGPQQQVITQNPKMGVHTRLTDEVEPWKIQRTLEMVRQIGAPWIVEYFLWAAHEPQRGVYDWSHADLVIDHAVNQGLTVVARLGYVPEWARPPRTNHLYLDATGYDDFARFAAAFAEHFRGRVKQIIIWNEPNLSQEWGFRPVDPAGYTQLLCRVYPAVKAANPDVQILAGALAPTLAPPGSEWGLNDLDYLQQMYDAGAAPCFDILAAHAYGWTFSPDDPPSADAVNFRRVELLRDIMVRNGDGTKQVMITEGGWNDHPRWTKAVRPAQRLEYTLRAYEKALQDWPWVDNLVMWAFRYPRPTGTYQDYYTFVGGDFQPKPIYLETQAYAEGLRSQSSQP
ncbi:MAG: beta-galactosidase [Anaerolineae bacterium]|nr:beta-galactosidase [Anaerolineae bacterium]